MSHEITRLHYLSLVIPTLKAGQIQGAKRAMVQIHPVPCEEMKRMLLYTSRTLKWNVREDKSLEYDMCCRTTRTDVLASILVGWFWESRQIYLDRRSP